VHSHRSALAWRRIARRLYLNGELRSGDLDERCVDAMAAMKEEMAESVVAKFMEANMSRVTNKSGFLMGTEYSDAKVANRNVGDFGWAIAHTAAARRPPISLYMIVP
jgi:hypothetical protein